ncbi:hypothetical protein MFUL124B02_24225 [Myxococcus fulvus 124B02]|nr:hypothetical protein MFUL124B02_24225 [Myxococcus fulvus 124B02]
MSAAECQRAGHEVELYEADTRVGGIWTRVNATSTLQISSMLYRFHPSVSWSVRYPDRDQVLGEIARLWRSGGLQACTRFQSPVSRLEPLQGGRWRINGREDYDAVICCLGTCHSPRVPVWEGAEDYQGERVHSSRLDGVDVAGRRVVVVGGGASSVESVEWALAGGARDVVMLVREDRWMVPRHAGVNVALSMLPALPSPSVRGALQRLLEQGFYRDLDMVVPDFPLYGVHEPTCNSDFLRLLREGRLQYLHGSPTRWTREGVQARLSRAPHARLAPGFHGRGLDEGSTARLDADLVVLATGFHPPPFDFLMGVRRDTAGLFLRGWIPGHPTLLFNNCGHERGFGTAGGLHLAIFTKLLLMFLESPETRPSREEMEQWVRLQGEDQRLSYAIYGEVLAQLATFLLHPRRWRHAEQVLREDVVGTLSGGARELVRGALTGRVPRSGPLARAV